jgi:hypothetical protein
VKKLLIILLAFLFAVSCATKEPEEVKVLITIPPQVHQTFKNFSMVMNEGNFLRNTALIVNEVSYYEPEIGHFLSLCEIAVSEGIDSLHGLSVTQNRMCVIALVKNEHLSVPSGLWYQFAPSDGRFVVAATSDLNGPEYPFLVVPEGEFDASYFIRVFAHEGLHLMRLKKGMDCRDPDDRECMIHEEVLAYETQFKVLRAQKLDGSFTVPDKISKNNKLALEMEQDLYNQYKQGSLKDYLIQIGY